TVSIYDGANASPIGTAVTAANGSWSFNLGTLANTVHSFTARAADSSGNVGVTQGAFIAGTTGSDTLTGTAGNDLVMGRGGSDTVVFGTNFGKDTISDFAASSSVIQFDHNVFADFATVLAHAAQVGTDTVITAAPTDVVTLHNISVSQLTNNNVHIA